MLHVPRGDETRLASLGKRRAYFVPWVRLSSSGEPRQDRHQFASLLGRAMQNEVEAGRLLRTESVHAWSFRHHGRVLVTHLAAEETAA